MSDDGKGTLYCKGWSGIYVNYTESYLVIKNCTVNTVGISGGGINGDGWNGTNFYGLTIDKANVTAEGTDGGRNYGSISYVLSLTLNDCFIASPTGAHFSTSLHAITTNDLQPSLEKIVIKCRAIDENNFPDEKFRAYVKTNFDGDNDGYLSDDEIATTTLITVGDMGISSLKGVEFFTALKYLHCYDNELTTLDVSMFPDLRILSCTRNKLTTLDVTHNPLLDDLGCGGNLLTELDVSQNPELLYLYCQSNQLTALNVTKNTKLKNLYCSGNKLTALDLSKNTELQDLQCYGNELTALDLATCTKLVSLDCSFNKLTALDLSNLAVGIYDIDVYFSNNQIGEEAMQTLVESLPTVVTGGLYAIDTSDPAEKNVINSLQVALAKTKNWTVMNYNGSDYEQYEGSVPTGIISIDNGKIIDNDAWYTIDGRRVDNPTKGVYIKNGKKVVIGEKN